MRNAHDTSGKVYSCSLCDHASPTAKALKKHIYMKHKCKDKYKCTVCGRAFDKSQSLKVSFIPPSSSLLKYYFYASFVIKQEHTATHTGEALYACPYCPITFAHHVNVYKHFRNIHKAEYAAYKQQDNPPTVLELAKAALERIHLKRSLTDSPTNRSTEDLVISSDIVVSAEENTSMEIETDSVSYDKLE